MTHVDLWFAYECAARACPSRRPGLSGCVLDVRLPVEPPQDGSAPEAPEVHCPACGEAMHFRDLWAADPAGYGGRGCGGGFRLPLETAVAQQRWHLALRQQYGARDDETTEAWIDRLHAGHVYAEGVSADLAVLESADPHETLTVEQVVAEVKAARTLRTTLVRLRTLRDGRFSREQYEAAVGEEGEPEDLGGDDPDLRAIARDLVEYRNLLAEITDAFTHAFGSEEGKEWIEACGMTEAIYAVCGEVAEGHKALFGLTPATTEEQGYLDLADRIAAWKAQRAHGWDSLEEEVSAGLARIDGLTTALGEVELALGGTPANAEWGPLAQAVWGLWSYAYRAAVTGADLSPGDPQAQAAVEAAHRVGHRAEAAPRVCNCTSRGEYEEPPQPGSCPVHPER